MNKGLVGLNVVLGIAVIVLFYLHFSGGNNTSNPIVNNTTKEVVSNLEDSLDQFLSLDSNITAKPIKIAYVDSDSLDKNLKMLKDVETEIRTKEEEIQNKIIAEKKRYEGRYKSKMQNFDSRRKNYASKAPTMTDAQLQTEEQSLMKLQQEIAGLEQKYSQELMMFQQKLEQEYMLLKSDRMRNYYGKVKGFCESIAKRLGFDFILIYQEGGAILYSNSTFDISKYVVEAINKEYDATNSVVVEPAK
jgi:outer membrane protein